MSRYGASSIQYQPRNFLLNNYQNREMNNRYYSSIASPGYSIQENNTRIPSNLQLNNINRSLSNISKEINTLGVKLDEFINRQDERDQRSEEREHKILEIIRSQNERVKRAEERERKIVEIMRNQDERSKRAEERERIIVEIMRNQDERSKREEERARRAEERQVQRDIALGSVLNRLNGNIIRLTEYSINNVSNSSSRIYGLPSINSLNYFSNGYSGNNYHRIF